MRTLMSALLLVFSVSIHAAEGMWQPHQLPQLEEELEDLGLKINPDKLTSLTEFPMNAIVSLGGCSASFVSPKGLVATNHHCVYGSVQYNSTPENNLLENGFLARDLKEEVPAAPGSRVYVTESLTNVTEQVLDGVSDTMSGLDRYQTIENNIKALIKECESTGIHRCGVPAFHHGMEYFLMKRLEIRDVRLVYAPATSIGKFGGDIDNWQWPRHTGDFGFYRAYVGKDGKPADYAEDNVPYEPESFLTINARDLEAGDYVMAAGYPGSTNRYRTADEVQNQFTWVYPNARQLREDIIEVIENNSDPGSKARLSYENTIASLANYAKNYRSMVESYEKSDFQQRRENMERELMAWLADNEEMAERYGPAVRELGKLIDQEQSTQARDLVLGYMTYADMPFMASRLYRLAVEQQKPDAEREPGYQERDLTQFRQSVQRLTRRYDEQVDKAILAYILERYASLPADQHVPALDDFFNIGESLDKQALQSRINELYAATDLDDESVRLEWMNKSPEKFRNSEDPMIRYAVATHDARMALEEESKELDGNMQQWRSRYMQALIAFKRSQDEPIYADANSTLRVTYGRVAGNQPRDGLRNTPFTTLEGILEKQTGDAPFNAPQKQLQLIREKTYGDYELESIDSVPVNFLSTVDITGGNSGSAIMNGEAQLVGLLFDGVYESIIGDWDFDVEKNRAIAVDARYMLWVMEYVDEADNLLDELKVIR
ncbi:S46 family peptidase [Gilvimarinus sp. F26214L]|uniref:S46 family peptidase n=1 Tax=Gilvimarinus sp. DZF01 TaxID=3461371 RepID=UPI00404570F9